MDAPTPYREADAFRSQKEEKKDTQDKNRS